MISDSASLIHVEDVNFICYIHDFFAVWLPDSTLAGFPLFIGRKNGIKILELELSKARN